MLMLAVMLLGIGSVPIAGGRLGALGHVRLRQAWTIPTALAVQVFITTVAPDGNRTGHIAAHLGSYLLAGAFIVANRDLPCIRIIAVGGALNLLVIAANGGVMPADADALQRAGWPAVSDQFENSTALADPKLLFLGDVFAVPKWVPFANVFSVGDILLVLGGIAAVHRLCGSRLAGGQPTRPTQPPPEELPGTSAAPAPTDPHSPVNPPQDCHPRIRSSPDRVSGSLGDHAGEQGTVSPERS